MSSAFIYPPDIMAPDGGISWEEFRRKVRRNCGTYLRSKGAPTMRGIMDEDIALSRVGRRQRQAYRKRQLDAFFDELKIPIEEMKRDKP